MVGVQNQRAIFSCSIARFKRHANASTSLEQEQLALISKFGTKWLASCSGECRQHPWAESFPRWPTILSERVGKHVEEKHENKRNEPGSSGLLLSVFHAGLGTDRRG
jgi:hypothetical protein